MISSYSSPSHEVAWEQILQTTLYWLRESVLEFLRMNPNSGATPKMLGINGPFSSCVLSLSFLLGPS